jgi:hypothetical protein
LAALAVALLTAVVAAALVLRDSGESTTAPTLHFRSRPDLQPIPVEITTATAEASAGLIFIAPKKKVVQTGPMIVDDTGQLVWFEPLDTEGIFNFRVQSYGGEPVLTWWRGKAVKGVGSGYYVIVDSSYHEIARVYAGNGLDGDIHEFLITPQRTALISIYRRVPWDLSALGGPRESSVWEGVIQEIDIASGRVLFEWHSAPEVAPAESYTEPPPPTDGPKDSPYDYFHINSIAVEPNGNLLVSARNTHTIYEIRRSDGHVVWRLGGKKSDFEMGPGTNFEWQHDARRQPDGTITLFDNGSDPKAEEHSRVLVLDVDTGRRKATLVRSYAHPEHLLASSQGNAQFLPDGHVFVGWGSQPYFTEFDRDGRVLLDGHFARGPESYRAFRFAWAGRPGDSPAIAATKEGNGEILISASWNGATEVARWLVLAGEDVGSLRPIRSVEKTQFETSVAVETDRRYVQVRALDARGTVLGSSRAIEVTGG